MTTKFLKLEALSFMTPLFAFLFNWVYTAGVAVLSGLIVWFAGSVLAFETAASDKAWYDNPLAALIGGGIVAFVLDYIRHRRTTVADSVKQHLSITDITAEMTVEELKIVLSEYKEREAAYARRERVLRIRHALKEVEAAEARIRHHRATSELNRVNGWIAMQNDGAEVPRIETKTEAELYQGIKDEIAAFKAALFSELEVELGEKIEH